MTVFSVPMMKFEKVDNGWKCTSDFYPFRAHFTKLEGIHPTPWMLDYVECIKDDMQDYIDSMHHYHKQADLIKPA